MQTFYFFLSHFHAIFQITSADELTELSSTLQALFAYSNYAFYVNTIKTY